MACEVQGLLRRFSITSRIPEPLRTAHLIAGGSQVIANPRQATLILSLRHFQYQISMRNPLKSRSGSGSGSLTALPA
ncbi:MAG: hypothetical protein USCGTAYLOR_02829 [Chromatiales bacterium USCg_Taylor]|nr:MAG: hypothetical protein USCGTAYLOR_02829 [Chromatiales bacterium USCg_Taylor]